MTQRLLVSGMPRTSPEQAARTDALLAATRALGLEITLPVDHGMAPIAAVHTPEYLTFLKTIHARWQQIEGASAEVIPNIHPNRQTASYPRAAVGQAGYHMADTAYPISAPTWNAVYWSTQTAISAANRILTGEPSAYALCRPPGHHAFAGLAGGAH